MNATEKLNAEKQPEPVQQSAPLTVNQASDALADAVAVRKTYIEAAEAADSDFERSSTACLTAHETKLEGAINNKRRAQDRREVTRERLAVATARVQAAEAELEQAHKRQAIATLAERASELDAAAAAVAAAVPGLVSQLGEVWGKLADARLAHLRAHRAIEQAKGLVIPGDPKEPMEARLMVTNDPVGSTAALVAYIANAPRREREQQDEREKRIAERRAQRLAGREGPDAKTEELAACLAETAAREADQRKAARLATVDEQLLALEENGAGVRGPDYLRAQLTAALNRPQAEA